MLEGGTLRHY
jgi:SNF2 family DNA or RNA helicase